jgi:hypothetical protein
LEEGALGLGKSKKKKQEAPTTTNANIKNKNILETRPKRNQSGTEPETSGQRPTGLN